MPLLHPWPSQKRAAQLIGINVHDYIRRRNQGLTWCEVCKAWYTASQAAPNGMRCLDEHAIFRKHRRK